MAADSPWGNYNKGGSSWGGGWDSWSAGGWDKQSWKSDEGTSQGAWGDYKGERGRSDNAWSSNTGTWDNVGANLEPINWDSMRLVPIEKHFYQEHPEVAARSPEEVAIFRKHHDIEILDGEDARGQVPNPVTSFIEAGFPDWLLGPLEKNYKEPTAIQLQTWPVAMQGRDLIGIAETGSGKTLAYALPMIMHVIAQADLKSGEGPVGVVLCPTRELAVQIDEVVRDFAGRYGIKSVAIYGGRDVRKQGYDLQDKNDIVIATPGRFIQLLNDGWTNLNRVSYVVLDEADTMLQKNFGDQIKLILSQVRPDRQVLMFSATWPKEVQLLAKEHCTASADLRPVTVRIGGDRLAACRNIEQKTLVMGKEAKVRSLVDAIKRSSSHIRGNQHKCLVFARRQDTVDEVVWRLQSEPHCLEVEGIHAGKKQTDRDWVIKEFKHGQLSCVVSTDVLGRGHDIPRVKYVINYDAPHSIEDYVHRVGRTGRAGETGYALTFMTQEDYLLAPALVEVLQETKQKVDPKLQEIAAMGAGQWSQEGWWKNGGEEAGKTGEAAPWANYQSSAREAG